MATNGSFNQQDQYKSSTEQYPATSGPADATTRTATGSSDLSKDEVGWYFVEQYYTTLSKSPEKLHLFYGKRSQFVSGLEADLAPVSVGRSAIQERIRELDFQDCKVRVSNVDSQGSFDNIVIQVIGETSNKSAELKKFVQTFVLAEQPTGYFVLNDIFRYIKEEGEEEQAPEEPWTGPLVKDVEMPDAQAAAEETAAPAVLDADVVDKKLETIEAEPAAVEEPTTNGTGETAPEVEESPVVETKEEETPPTPEAVEKAVEEEVKEPEKPSEPAPTPVISRLPSNTNAKPPTPVQPAAPAKPLTWASRAAAAAGPLKPVMPVVTPKTSTPPAQPRAAPPSTPAKSVQAQAPSNTAAAEKDKENTPTTPGGWQMAGSDHAKRQNRPQSISGPPEKEGTMGYVRNVTEKVADAELRAALSKWGNLIYFDINRSKNCAFVEYSSPKEYQAAAAANPHKVDGEDIYVEPRRPKANAYGGNGYQGPRGGMNQRGRGGFEQGRPGNQGQRGNFQQNRGRGGGAGGAPRGGRGTSQATNA